MRACTVMLLCAAVAVVAAPPPPPRARPGPWFAGWDRPEGGGRFDREGDKLTVTVPGKETAPARLLRDVEGDFAVQVRVALPPTAGGHREAAGLVLTHGKQQVHLVRTVRLVNGSHLWVVSVTTAETDQSGDVQRHTARAVPDPAAGKPAYLRVERRGDRVRVMFGEDGKGWTLPGPEKELKLPEKLKVGVTTHAAALEEFKVVFDQFKLTPLGGKTR